MKNLESIAIENKARRYDNLLAYVEQKAIEFDNFSTLAFKDLQEYGYKHNEMLFNVYEAQKRAYLDILNQADPSSFYYVENGKVKSFEDELIF